MVSQPRANLGKVATTTYVVHADS